MSDVFEQIKQELKENTPIFDSVSNTLKPLMQSSEIVGGLKALISLSEKITERVNSGYKLTGDDIMRFIDQVRDETVRNRRG
jgi:hypothetical protein